MDEKSIRLLIETRKPAILKATKIQEALLPLNYEIIEFKQDGSSLCLVLKSTLLRG